jgi:hypothetical protein
MKSSENHEEKLIKIFKLNRFPPIILAIRKAEMMKSSVQSQRQREQIVPGT